MASFGKSRQDAGKKTRYDFEPILDDEIEDILLSDKKLEPHEAPLTASLIEPTESKGDELIYDLVVDEKNTFSSQNIGEQSAVFSGAEFSQKNGASEEAFVVETNEPQGVRLFKLPEKTTEEMPLSEEVAEPYDVLLDTENEYSPKNSITEPRDVLAESDAEFESEQDLSDDEPEFATNSDSQADEEFENEGESQLSADELSAQVEKLSQEYHAVNMQLEKSLIAIGQLNQKLEESQKSSPVPYVIAGVASFAFLLSLGGVVSSVNMERDITDLKSSIAALIAETTVDKKQLAERDKSVDKRLSQLNEKVTGVFANNVDNSVLQVTRELRKQVSALANKNLAILNSRSHSDSSHPVKSTVVDDEKTGSSTLKLVDKNQPDAKKEPSQALSAKTSADTDTVQPVGKTETNPSPTSTAVKLDAPADKTASEKVQPVKDGVNTLALAESGKTEQQDADTDKEEDTDATSTESSSSHRKPSKQWTVSFGSFKDKNLAKIAAAKLKASGVSAEVVQVKRNKKVWYRVVGHKFKNKKDAQNHAAQAKKELGLYSVVVPKK